MQKIKCASAAILRQTEKEYTETPTHIDNFEPDFIEINIFASSLRSQRRFIISTEILPQNLTPHRLPIFQINLPDCKSRLTLLTHFSQKSNLINSCPLAQDQEGQGSSSYHSQAPEVRVQVCLRISHLSEEQSDKLLSRLS